MGSHGDSCAFRSNPRKTDASLTADCDHVVDGTTGHGNVASPPQYADRTGFPITCGRLSYPRYVPLHCQVVRADGYLSGVDREPNCV